MSEAVLKAVPDAKRRKTTDRQCHMCVLCGRDCDEDRSKYPLDSWNSMKIQSQKWHGLDKFGNVYDEVEWDSGPVGVYFHQTCRTAFTSQRTLEQAKARKNKHEVFSTTSTIACAETNKDCSSQIRQKSRLHRSSTGPLHNKDLCVWCMKPEDRKHSVQGNWCLLQQLRAWQTFKAHTIFLDDIEMRDRILALISATLDPFASEIRYHRSCWKKYVSPMYHSGYNTEEQMHVQNIRIAEVKQMFFQHVREAIFELQEPRTLQGLLKYYATLLNNYGFDSSGIKSATIKDMLQLEFQNTIAFHNRFQKNKSTIVYDATVAGGSYIEAAINAWGINDEQLLQTAARRLNDRMSKEVHMNWPPHIDDLEGQTKPNSLLQKFISWIRNPSIKTFEEEANDPRVKALSSVMQSYITSNRTPFQCQLSVTVHGLTRSREIIDFLKKFGLGISYDDVLNIYKAWTKFEVESSDVCPQELAEGFPCIAIMDNDDFQDDTLTGANTSHRTNVMFLQPENIINKDARVESQNLGKVNAKEIKELTRKRHSVHPYKTLTRGVPSIQTKVDTSLQCSKNFGKLLVLHALTRIDTEGCDLCPEKQTVGMFNGFNSAIYTPVVKSKPYYHLTLPQPPKKSVVHEVMCRMVDAVQMKTMPFLSLVGDQPVYALIVELKNENPTKFDVIVPFLGPFHAHCSFMAAIHKRFLGSGLSDILVAAEVMAEGSVDQALSGRHYKRGIRCLRLMYEALARLVIRKGFSDGIKLPTYIEINIPWLRDQSSYSQGEMEALMDDLQSHSDFAAYVDAIFANVDRLDNPMAKYWKSFMDMVQILFMNIHALRTQSWDMFKVSLRLMLPWLHIYDNDKYSKWLLHFWLQMSSLPEEHADYMSQIFSQSITGKPYSCLPLDLWIEMTMNKGSKMKAGWMHILKNEEMLLSHTINANSVNRVRAALHEEANLKESCACHAENSKFRLCKDENAVQNIVNCLLEFQCNPFDESNTTLTSLQSGQIATDELVHDFETAHADGEILVNTFFTERMFSDNIPFHATMHRNKRSSFSKPPSQSTAAQSMSVKSVAMENKAMASVLALASKMDAGLDLIAIMKYRLSDECLALFNANGTMRKVQKSRLIAQLNIMDLPQLNSYIALVDMGFLWRLATPSAEDREKGDQTSFTWSDYARKLFSLIMARHPKAFQVILVNDPYTQQTGIKDSEHERRAKYMGGSKNLFMKAHDALPPPQEFARMFTNSANKNRLQDFLRNEFNKIAQIYPHVQILYSLTDNCWNLSGIGGNEQVCDYQCSHVEADSILLYIYLQLRKKGDQSPVVIDAEDTDVVVLAAYVAHTTDGILGIRRKKIVIDCRKLCSPEVAQVLIPLHLFTGADSVSGFFGHGKRTICKNAMESVEAQALLSTLGTGLPVTSNTIKSMEMFTIRYIYNDNVSKNLAEARANKWRQMKVKAMQRLPPDPDSHALHVARVNYQVYTLFKCNEPGSPPDPCGHGWTLVDGMCQPQRFAAPSLPTSLRHICTAAEELKTHAEDEDAYSNVDAESCEQDDFSSDDEYSA